MYKAPHGKITLNARLGFSLLYIVFSAILIGAVTLSAYADDSSIQLTSPSNGSEQQADGVVLKWTGGFPNYEVQGANDPSFTDLYPIGFSEVNSCGGRSGEFNKTYYWRVRGFKDAAKTIRTAWSPVWSYKTQDMQSYQVILLQPQNGATKVRIFPMSCSWSPAPIPNYQIQLSKDGNFTQMEADTSGLVTTGYEHLAKLGYQTTYYWRVRCKIVGETTSFTNWSEVWHFTTESEAVSPSVPASLPNVPNNSEANPPIWVWFVLGAFAIAIVIIALKLIINR